MNIYTCIFMRRKWLKVFGIDRCHDWQSICCDHFLEENYKPRKNQFLFSNAIPQSYDRNGFHSNYATQSKDVETGNNVVLPMEQHIIREQPEKNMDQVMKVLEPEHQFAKDSIRLVKKCTKPCRKELKNIAVATAIGFEIMGFIGFSIKLIHIPINNIIKVL